MGVIIIIAVFWLLGLLMAVECPMARVLRIPLSDIVRVSCGLCGTVRSHGRPIPGHVLTREESIWLQPFASWS